MRITKLVIIILVAGALLSYIKSGRSFNIVRALPFCDGSPANSVYHLGSLLILLITCWGFYRLARKQDGEE